jgi:hypothetical protein
MKNLCRVKLFPASGLVSATICLTCLFFCVWMAILVVSCRRGSGVSPIDGTNGIRVIRVLCHGDSTISVQFLHYGTARVAGEAAIAATLRDGRFVVNSNDVVILQWPESKANGLRPNVSYGNEVIAGIVGICENARVQLCHYVKGKGMPDISEVEVYHWVSPYDDPRDQTRTMYFCEDGPLGSGMSGFSNLLVRCKTTSAKAVGFVSSRYSQNESWSDVEVPFDERVFESAKDEMRRRGIEIVYLRPHWFLFYRGDPVGVVARPPHKCARERSTNRARGASSHFTSRACRKGTRRGNVRAPFRVPPKH